MNFKSKEKDMKEHKEVEQSLRAMTDFVLQFDEETQELWMRLFERFTKQVLIEEETEEFETLCSKLRLVSADPWPIDVMDEIRKSGLCSWLVH